MRLVPRLRARVEACALALLPVALVVAGVAVLLGDRSLLVLMALFLAGAELVRAWRWDLRSGPEGLTAVRPGARGVVTTYAAWADLVGVGELRGLAGRSPCLVYARPQQQRGPAGVLAVEARMAVDRVVPVGSFEPAWRSLVAQARPDVDLDVQVPLPEALVDVERQIRLRYLLVLGMHLVGGLLAGGVMRVLLSLL